MIKKLLHSGSFTAISGKMPILLLVTLVGCDAKKQEQPAPVLIRPALIHTVGVGEKEEKLRFPGRLRATKRAELSFNVPGFVADFSLSEGSKVTAGQVIARLDDSVYQARVRAAQSEFERARVDLDRYQRLFDNDQAVSSAEVDDRRTRLETARTNLASAQQDLNDTQLKAPFTGVIARRRLETYTSVQAKQAIAELQDLKSLEVVINVPQRLLQNRGPRAEALAYFDGCEQVAVPLIVTSYASEANPVTQTYEVVLALQARPKCSTLLPGMSVTVLPLSFNPSSDKTPRTVSIPLTAVTTDAEGAPSVWMVDEEWRVQQVAVVLGDVYGGMVEVQSGLHGAERIVESGVSALRPGMKVRSLDAR